jgi:hypothetical protein
VDSLSILLGWLLGMLSPVIVSNIQKKYTKETLHGGICTEFNELRYILIHNTCILGEKSGKFDRAFLQWFIQKVGEYPDKDITDKTVLAFNELLKSDDATIAAYVRSEREKASAKSLSLKKISAKFTDLNLAELSIFKVHYQSLLFELKRLIDNINDEIVKVETLCGMTFDSSLIRENHIIVKQSINDKYSQIQSMSITLVNKMTDFLNEKKY